MKPLHVSELKTFQARFERFSGSEIKAMTIKSPSVIEIQFSVQDTGRAFDWIDIAFELSNVNDAKLVENGKLAYIDMSEGISILFQENKFILSLGEYNTLQSAKDSPLYIICESIKFKELPFSG
jgi:hypothetical protein